MIPMRLWPNTIKKDTGTITFFSVDAGQGLSEHTAPFDAVVHIPDGLAEIAIGSNKHVVKAGEILVMPANNPPARQANEQFKILLIMIRGN
jgi:quercetin dioxygenase-like cupin family protein